MREFKIKKIHFAPRFFKSFEKLHDSVKTMAKKKDKLFRINPFDPKLHTHKLKGKLSGAWSYYINHDYRILFRFIKQDEVLYYDIGTHEIYNPNLRIKMTIK
ncbi:MAG: type II toxin-antitoxin system mRNA interferase toxin, RelE/StbE family [Armatimonadetes bacterium CG07_land_8_20_14_0_80_40_9]|nr:MAG: type II toxin-antitoxin system mRNA interferase toxin, RelE/StbE family [Armatimonadetes bacterium CG07_land_8_20_14_0_80_40_9]